MWEEQMRVCASCPSETRVPGERASGGHPALSSVFPSGIHVCPLCLRHRADGSYLTYAVIWKPSRRGVQGRYTQRVRGVWGKERLIPAKSFWNSGDENRALEEGSR